MDVVDAQLQRVGTTVDLLLGDLNHLDVAQCDIEQLAAAAALTKRLRARLSCVDADIARRKNELAADVGELPVENRLDPQRQRSRKQDTADADRAEVLDEFPGMDDATRSGELPGEYADVVARALAKLSEPERAEFCRRHHDLDALAGTRSLHAFGRQVRMWVEKVQADFGANRSERQHRRRKVRMWEDIETGMGHVHAELDPETYARVKQALNGRADQLYNAGRDDPNDTRTRDQLLADALVDLICHQPATTMQRTAGGSGTNLIVLIDWETLTGGLHDDSVCETGNGVGLPVDEVRRMACDAEIIPVVLGGHGETLDVGRSKRLATEPQRSALRAMYPTCAIDGCTVPFDACEIHHLKPWEPPFDGPTDLNNLAPLCARGPNHHTQWHRHHWTGHINPTDRALWITYPDGTTEHHPLPKHAA